MQSTVDSIIPKANGGYICNDEKLLARTIRTCLLESTVAN